MGGDLDVASVPGTGSSFVLALPGPAGAGPERVVEALESALAAEEVRLEERAVLRAMASARPRLVAGGTASLEDPDRGRSAVRPRPRLTALDGRASRNTGGTPA
jgi:hypothetical protein